jgi:hypothetical protein
MSLADRKIKARQLQLTKAKPQKYITIFLIPLCQHVNKKERKEERNMVFMT